MTRLGPKYGVPSVVPSVERGSLHHLARHGNSGSTRVGVFVRDEDMDSDITLLTGVSKDLTEVLIKG